MKLRRKFKDLKVGDKFYRRPAATERDIKLSNSKHRNAEGENDGQGSSIGPDDIIYVDA